MRYLAIIIVVLLCAVSLESQISPGALHRLIGNPNTAAGPASIPGLAHWWVASDLGSNTNFVTNWVDRIQNEPLINNGTTTRPTNSIYGVYFDGANDVLTNVAGITFTSNHTLIFLFYKTASQNSYLITSTWATPLTGLYDIGGNFNVLTNGATQFNVNAPPWGRWVDLAYVANDTIPMTGIYTNGVKSGTNSAVFTYSWKYISNNNYTPHWNGYIREIIDYTNALTVTQLGIIQDYITNQYNFLGTP